MVLNLSIFFQKIKFYQFSLMIMQYHLIPPTNIPRLNKKKLSTNNPTTQMKEPRVPIIEPKKKPHFLPIFCMRWAAGIVPEAMPIIIIVIGRVASRWSSPSILAPLSTAERKVSVLPLLYRA